MSLVNLTRLINYHAAGIFLNLFLQTIELQTTTLHNKVSLDSDYKSNFPKEFIERISESFFNDDIRIKLNIIES